MFNSVSKISDGCFKICFETFTDLRGDFTKIFHQEEFKNKSLSFPVNEMYVSTSVENTIRGMHFQSGEHAHKKLVICLSGSILDVMLDLRSKYYGDVNSISLSKNEGVILDKGIAHGFKVTSSEPCCLLYCTSTVYSPDHDQGILWNSIDFDWQCSSEPVISKRDLLHPKFKDNKFKF